MTLVFNEIDELSPVLFQHSKAGEDIAFVPTMGALHEGHASLMAEAKRNHAVAVASIFVNPTQFNDKKDLDKYPRTLDQDFKLCESVGLDYLYVPSEYEVYPPGLNTSLDIDLKGMDKVMEGAFRPGHFEGVCQVVKRLLDLVRPSHLYMGQKDFQQFTIIGQMIAELGLPVKLVVVPTSREKSGLARSSRNTRLSPAGKKKAAVIFRTLRSIGEKKEILSVAELEAYGMKRLKRAGLDPEYITISDGKTLQPLTKLEAGQYAVVCAAAWLEGVRLIDNLIL